MNPAHHLAAFNDDHEAMTMQPQRKRKISGSIPRVPWHEDPEEEAAQRESMDDWQGKGETTAERRKRQARADVAWKTTQIRPDLAA